jgi:hypothetical protein
LLCKALKYKKKDKPVARNNTRLPKITISILMFHLAARFLAIKKKPFEIINNRRIGRKTLKKFRFSIMRCKVPLLV